MKWIRALCVALAVAATISALLPAFNTLFLKPAVLRILIEATERDTLRIGRHLTLTAFPEHEGKPIPGLEYGDLVREMHMLAKLYNLKGVKLYDPDGRIYFSTSSQEINRRITSSFFVERVTKGQPYSLFRTQTEEYDPKAPRQSDLVQTFVPVMSAGEMIGALEIDYDITDRKHHLDTLLEGTSTFLFCSSTLVLTLLLLLAARYRTSEVNRENAELKLHHANRRLFEIIEFLPDATFVIDREGKVVAWNRSMETMTGVSKQEILGRGDYAYAIPFYGERRPMLIDMIGRPEAELTEIYAHVERREDTMIFESPLTVLRGEKQTYLWGTASPLLDPQGNQVGAIETIRDITERRTAQEEVARQHALLENILEQIPHAVYWKSMDGRYQGGNSHFARLFGLETLAEIVGQRDGELPWCDADRQHHQESDEQVLHGEVPLHSSEREFRLAGDELRTLMCNKVPLHNAEDSISGVLGIFTDVTERKRIDENLRTRQRMEAIGTLAGGIAHDFNNILTAVIGYTEAAKFTRDSDPGYTEHLDRVLQAANRARTLVEQILTFGRQVEGKRHAMKLEPVIGEALALLRASFSPQVVFDVELKCDSEVILADDTQMHQVIMNLATNACQAMSPGGTLSIRLDNVTVDEPRTIRDVRLEAGRHVCLTVSDTGEGIAPETLARIFDPYFTTKQRGKGSGLGLAVVHGIVTAHGGAIEVDSTCGEGTSFRVFFPCAEMHVAEKPCVENRAERGEHILFVDDEEPLVSLWQQTLEEQGFRVTGSTCSKRALELFHSTPEAFDLVITDLSMPEVCGLELIQAIRDKRLDMPIILCTAFRDSVTHESARRLGASEFLLKPFDRQLFVNTVERALSA